MPRTSSEGPRKQVDLEAQRNLSVKTLHLRFWLVQLFCNWLASHAGPAFEEFVEMPVRDINKILCRYGQIMYNAGAPYGAFHQTLMAITDRNRGLVRQLGASWDVARTWQQLMPRKSHIPTPVAVFRAMLALALLWGWLDMAILLSIGFLCCLRPGEAFRLVVGSVVLPSPLLLDAPIAYVRLGATKMSYLGARWEHVILDEPLVIDLLEALWPRLPPHRRIFFGSPSLFRRMHDALVSHFGISTTDGVGLTPASHRGGGATRLFQTTGNVSLVQWRARWRRLQSMEVYIQEVASQSVLPSLSAQERLCIRRFAESAPALLSAVSQKVRELPSNTAVSLRHGVHM